MTQHQNNGVSAAARNVAEIARLEREVSGRVPRAERIGIAITRFAGTPAFAIGQVLSVVSWIGWNVLARPAWRFDAYPFGLLATTVSIEGVLLAILVVTTQNRMSKQSDRRDHLDLQVDLLAEQEMTMVLRMLNRISEHLGVPPDDRERGATRELMEHTNIYELMEELGRKFN